jgi:hypothetical protein
VPSITVTSIGVGEVEGGVSVSEIVGFGVIFGSRGKSDVAALFVRL